MPHDRARARRLVRAHVRARRDRSMDPSARRRPARSRQRPSRRPARAQPRGATDGGDVGARAVRGLVADAGRPRRKRDGRDASAVHRRPRRRRRRRRRSPDAGYESGTRRTHQRVVSHSTLRGRRRRRPDRRRRRHRPRSVPRPRRAAVGGWQVLPLLVREAGESAARTRVGGARHPRGRRRPRQERGGRRPRRHEFSHGRDARVLAVGRRRRIHRRGRRVLEPRGVLRPGQLPTRGRPGVTGLCRGGRAGGWGRVGAGEPGRKGARAGAGDENLGDRVEPGRGRDRVRAVRPRRGLVAGTVGDVRVRFPGRRGGESGTDRLARGSPVRRGGSDYKRRRMFGCVATGARDVRRRFIVRRCIRRHR
mmetsp:Transcript_11502/g.48149  ORF Transcript_11502/g.48149 Transcript_11502/m.48149 type:complete len:365 (+) Transcript_11502:301-1395(+)